MRQCLDCRTPLEFYKSTVLRCAECAARLTSVDTPPPTPTDWKGHAEVWETTKVHYESGAKMARLINKNNEADLMDCFAIFSQFVLELYEAKATEETS